jgi:hypothetical protein
VATSTRTPARQPEPVTPAAPERAERPSADDLAWIGAIAGAVLLGIAYFTLAPLLAHLYPAPDHDVFAIWQGQIIPEAHEEVRAMLTLGAPILLALVIATIGSPRQPRRALDPLIVAAQIIGVGLLVVAVLEQERRSGFLPIDYFDEFLLSPANLIAGVLIGIGLTALVLRWSGQVPRWAVRIGEALRNKAWLAFGLAALATAIWLLPSVVTDTTIDRSGAIAIGHIPIQGEDYFAAVNGRTPLVNFIADYANLLPLLVAPILGAFNSSISAYTCIMCALSGLGLLAVYGVFGEVTGGRWKALALYVPFVALALFPWNQTGPFRETDAIYFGVLPGRYFGPFILAWLLALSFRRRIPIWALYGASGLVVLNNYEFGTAALLALTAALVTTWDRTSPLRGRLLSLAGWAAAGLVGAVALVSVITLIRAGGLPNPSYLTYFSRLFLQDSYGLVPMHTLGLHWALYLTYAASLVVAAVRYVRGEPDRTLTGMLAFAGVFGLVTAMYFVGRSSQFQLMLLFPAWGLALALLAWTAGRALRSAAGQRDRLRRLLVPAGAALIGFGVMISATDRLPPPWRQVERLQDGGPAIYDETAAQDFIKSRTSPGEDVLIIGTPLDHRVAERAGVSNVSPLNGLFSLITRDQADLAIDQLEDNGGDLVFDAVSGPAPPQRPAPAVPEFAGILQAHGFQLIATDPASHLRLWRRTS